MRNMYTGHFALRLQETERQQTANEMTFRILVLLNI